MQTRRAIRGVWRDNYVNSFDRTERGVKHGDVLMTYQSIYQDILIAGDYVHNKDVSRSSFIANLIVKREITLTYAGFKENIIFHIKMRSNKTLNFILWKENKSISQVHPFEVFSISYICDLNDILFSLLVSRWWHSWLHVCAFLLTRPFKQCHNFSPIDLDKLQPRS